MTDEGCVILKPGSIMKPFDFGSGLPFNGEFVVDRWRLCDLKTWQSYQALGFWFWFAFHSIFQKKIKLSSHSLQLSQFTEVAISSHSQNPYHTLSTMKSLM